MSNRNHIIQNPYPTRFGEIDPLEQSILAESCNKIAQRHNANVFLVQDETLQVAAIANDKVFIFEQLDTIGRYAFRDAIAMKEIYISGDITTIGEGAFNGCTNLQRVFIGKNVNDIGTGAFGACSSIERFVVDPNNKCFGTSKEDLINTQDNVFVRHASGSSNPYCTVANFEAIEDGAFATSKNLVRVDISDVHRIGDCAFISCPNLLSVRIEGDNVSIGNHAFAYSGVETIKLPPDVHVDESAFENARALQHVYVGDVMINIKSPADLTNLPSRIEEIQNSKVLEHASQTPDVHSDLHSQLEQMKEIVAQLEQERRQIERNMEIIDKVKNGEEVVIINNGKLETYAGEVDRLIIPADVKEIGDYAFRFAVTETITIPDSVEKISPDAFKEAFVHHVEAPERFHEQLQQMLGPFCKITTEAVTDTHYLSELTKNGQAFVVNYSLLHIDENVQGKLVIDEDIHKILPGAIRETGITSCIADEHLRFMVSRECDFESRETANINVAQNNKANDLEID